jgi:predicted acylesterase/phospholipase RssA
LIPLVAGLVDAVAASRAIPGVWAPVTIVTRHFIDEAGAR